MNKSFDLNGNEMYNTDMEIVVDFMKLAMLFISKDFEVTQKDKLNIIELESQMLELLPTPQNERMNIIHDLMKHTLYKHKQMIQQSEKTNNDNETDNKTDDKYVILFFDSNCPACKRIRPEWELFKRTLNNTMYFTILEYDNVQENEEVFKYFKIKYVPTIMKVDIDRKKQIEQMKTEINLKSLLSFAKF